MIVPEIRETQRTKIVQKMLPDESFISESRHIGKVLSDTLFCGDPFAHIYSPCFFSKDFYSELRANMPPISEYLPYLGSDGKP